MVEALTLSRETPNLKGMNKELQYNPQGYVSRFKEAGSSKLSVLKQKIYRLILSLNAYAHTIYNSVAYKNIVPKTAIVNSMINKYSIVFIDEALQSLTNSGQIKSTVLDGEIYYTI